MIIRYLDPSGYTFSMHANLSSCGWILLLASLRALGYGVVGNFRVLEGVRLNRNQNPV